MRNLSLHFSILILSVLQLDGQTHFQHLPDNNPLSQLIIQDIYQDRKGFLWIGTAQGLIRYDGVETRTFRHRPFDPSSICSNNIWAICEDQDHPVLWIATMGGLVKYDLTKEQFTNYSYDQELRGEKRCPSEVNITHVTQATDGRVWLSTGGGGLNVFDPHSELFTFFFPDSTTDYASNFNHLGYIAEDAAGAIWFGTQADLIRLDPTKGTMDRFSEQIGVIKTNFALVADAKKRIFTMTSRGLFRYDPEKESFKQLPLAIDNWEESYGVRWEDFYPESLLADSQGRLWFGGWDNGLFVYDLGSGQITHFRHHQSESSSLAHNSIYALFEDQDHRIWIGTKGLDRLDPFAQKSTFIQLERTERLSGFNPIAGITEDEYGNLWVSSIGSGLTLLQPDRQFGGYFLLNQPGTGQNYFRNSVKATNGDLWIETWMSGVHTFDPQTKQFSEFPKIEELPADPDRFWRLDETSVAMISNRQLFFYDEVENTLDVFPDSFASIYSTRPYRPAILKDRRGYIWLGMDGEGLVRYNPETKSYLQFQHEPGNPASLTSNRISTLYEDKQGRLWIGTNENGLNLLVPPKSLDGQFYFRHWLQKGGGLISDQILSLQEDDEERIWICTTSGISCFDPSTENFKNYDVLQCGQSFMWPDASCKDQNGLLYFGGMEGISVFNPDQVPENLKPPVPVITQLSVDNELLSVGEAFLPQAIEFTEKIVLTHDQNDLTLAFAALDYTHPIANQYQYRLAGYQEYWTTIDGVKPKATFTNIPPGNYTFQLMAGNPDDIWTETPLILEVNILPPWWETGWARALWLVLLLGVLYLLNRLQLNRRLAQAEQQRLQELDDLKTKLYTNITHEFRTPLTIILGLTGQLVHQMSEHAKKNISLIQDNAGSLLKLVNQMLELSRAESGNQQLDLRRGDIIRYLRYLLRSFHSLAQQKGVTIELNSELEEFEMDFDQERLMHIMSNLLSNAIKFSESGQHVEVTVELSRNHENNSCLQINVKDNGTGIAEESLEQIFDRYYQIRKDNGRPVVGTGIGLPLAKELVELMGGEIFVESTPGSGSVFTVRLPVHRKQGKVVKMPELLLPTIGQVNASPVLRSTEDKDNHPLVLIIEDHPDLIHYLEGLLYPSYRLAMARNGREGIDKAIELIPDMIVTDIIMPEKNGYEVCSFLKDHRLTSHIPVIMLTAKAGPDARLTGFKRGADAYLSKPFRREDLLVRMENLLSQRQKLQAYYRTKSGIGDAGFYVDIPSITSEKEQSFLEECNRVVSENLTNKDLNIEYLAGELFVSTSSLYRKVKALTGHNPTQYIRAFRLSIAKKLLVETDLSIASISLRSGFNDANYFSKTFKQEEGLTPSEFRAAQSADQ